MKNFYSVNELARSGLLPYKNRVTIMKLIKSGKLKATNNGMDGVSVRWHISKEAVQEFLNLK